MVLERMSEATLHELRFQRLESPSGGPEGTQAVLGFLFHFESERILENLSHVQLNGLILIEVSFL